MRSCSEGNSGERRAVSARFDRGGDPAASGGLAWLFSVSYGLWISGFFSLGLMRIHGMILRCIQVGADDFAIEEEIRGDKFSKEKQRFQEQTF